MFADFVEIKPLNSRIIAINRLSITSIKLVQVYGIEGVHPLSRLHIRTVADKVTDEWTYYDFTTEQEALDAYNLIKNGK